MYTPINNITYTAAYKGALSGMESGRGITSTNPADYANAAEIAQAYAQEFDTVWAATATDGLNLDLIEELSNGIWIDRNILASPDTLNPSSYLDIVDAIIAVIQAAEFNYAGQGIIPPLTTMVVPNKTVLALVTGVENGGAVFVNTYQAYWRLDKTSILPLINDQVIAAAGGGRWFRQAVQYPDWMNKPFFAIDPVSGDDEALGYGATAAAANLIPLKTLAEWSRRIGPGESTFVGAPAVIAGLNIRQTIVNVLNDVPESDPLAFQARIMPVSMLAFLGNRTIVASGAFTLVTALNRATNQAWEVTDATITWANHIGRQIRVPATNMIGVIVKDLGAGVARVSAPADPVLPANASSPSPLAPPENLFLQTVTPGTFLAGQAFVIEDTTKMWWLDPAVDGVIQDLPLAGSDLRPVIGFANIDVQIPTQIPACQQPNVRAPRISTGGANLKGCRIRGNYATSTSSFSVSYLLNCSTFGCSVHAGAILFIRAGASVGPGAFPNSAITGVRGGVLYLDNDFIQQGASTQCQYGQLNLNLCGFFDAAGTAISLNLRTGHIRQNVGPNVAGITAVYGSGSTGVGLSAIAGMTPQISTLSIPTVTGALGDFTLAGATTSFPFDPVTGAYAAVPVANTWANWLVATPGGFLNGGAHNVAQNTHLVYNV